jgi:signal transduction histidine kinase
MTNRRSKKDMLKRTATLQTQLAEKERELAIEAALEKVRAVAMQMKKPADLPDVCKTLYKQLLSLGFAETRNAMINIHDDASKSFVNYDYSDEIGKSTNQLTYNIHPLIEKQIKKIRSANDAFSETYFTGKDLAEWKKFRKRIGEKDDPRIAKNKGLYYYFYSIGTGSIGISTFGGVSREKKALLKRFRNVFKLSYQRYIDIAKAEAQAREAKIEAALERVRASSMAMHHSSELHKVIKEVNAQLTLLGFDFDTTNITTDLTPAGFYVWNASPATPIPSGVFIPYKDIYVINWIYADWGVHEGIRTFTFNKTHKNAFFKHYLTHTEGKGVPDERKKYILNAKSLNLTTACRKEFALDIINYRDIIYTGEQNNILERFAKVFEQSYTRFLDLKKAEAQAREAQIELGLERVRAKAMAMHSTVDLAEAVNIFFKELKTLEISPMRCGIGEVDEKKQSSSLVYTTADKQGELFEVLGTLKHEGHPVIVEIFRHWKSQEEYHPVLQGSGIREYYRAIRSQVTLPEFARHEKHYGNYFYFREGFLFTWAEKELSEEGLRIARKFTSVLSLTYRRYRDLKEAEAQAREAKIEAALERVRSRSMAMHHSSDLQEVIKVVAEQFIELGLRFDSTNFAKVQSDGSWDVWISTPQQVYPAQILFPYFAHRVFTDVNDMPVSGKDFVAREYTREEKDSFFKYFFENTVARNIPEARKQYVYNAPGFVRSIFLLKNISFTVACYDGIPYSDKENAVFRRFATVFEQAYTRFLDLQKAEAQAREAQIEASLERVRARGLAMHSSTELPEAAKELFQQVQSLGMPSWAAGYCIWEDDKNAITAWMHTEGAMQPPMKYPTREEKLFIEMTKGYESGKALHVVEMGGDGLVAHYRYMYTLPGVAEMFDSIAKAGHPLPTFQVMHYAYFSKGFLMFITYEHVLAAHDIFKRFASVFDQTYTRFLDLQTAEAQAREAQIQLALERVRARTMAMHRSDELAQVAELLFKQVSALGIKTWTTGFNVWSKDNNSYVDYVTNPEGGFMEPYTVDMTQHEILIEVSEARKRGEEFFVQFAEGKKLQDLYLQLTKFGDKKQFEKILESGFQFPAEQYHHFVFGSKVSLMFITYDPAPEAHELFKRFGRVFEQTYTRFLDLQRAETQTRESQIQLALERVRARTMAMHKSVELAETAQVMFQQLLELGSVPDRIAIGVVDEPAGVVNFWSTDQSGSHVDRSFKARLNERTVMSKAYRAWKDEKKSLVIDLHGDDLKEWLQFVRTELKVIVRDEFIKDRRVHNFGFFSHGWILVTTHEPQSAETIQILERFASVFSLTYRRFLDLEKAEAQAREAQIEASLERVRSKAMAMHNSADLSSAASIVFTELKKLGIKTIRSGISLQYKESRKNLLYTSTSTDKEENLSLIGWAILDDHPVLKEIYDSWMRGEDYFPVLKGDALKLYYEKIKSNFKLPIAHAQDYEQHGFFMAFTHGMFYGWAEKTFDDNEKNILKRFASVVDLTFKRYFDLQKAEANAREAQIEASLERVRSKTMAMHNSNDVGETVTAMFAEFVHLGIHTNRCGILIFNDVQTAEVWTARSTPEGNAKLIIGKLDLDAHKMLRSVYNAWIAKETFYQYDLLDDDVLKYYTAINNSEYYPVKFDLDALPSTEFHSDFLFTDGAVFSFTNEPVAEEPSKIMKRFAGLFGQTYRRYLDLQKAEANAREAQIEAGLERVRAKAMAMHKTDDLNPAVAIVFEELEKLHLGMLRCGIGILDKEKRSVDVWSTSTSDHGDNVQVSGAESMDIHPLLQGAFNAWLAQTDFSYTLKGEDLFQYYSAVDATNIRLPQSQTEVPTQYYHVTPFKAGSLFAFRETEFSEEGKMVMKRFANVFNLTYNRFLDLQKAEAQVREAQIEAGLERVRSRTMAMFKSDELAETAVVVFKQMNGLGIVPNRLYIVIINDDSGNMEFWITDENGDKIGSRHMVNVNQNISLKTMYDGWADRKKTIIIDQQGKELQDWLSYWKKNFGVSFKDDTTIKRRVQTIAYFSKGFIAIASPDDEPRSTINVLERFAAVFNLTYTRFNDLQQAEAQAREAQIEAGLERVRARTMAMHSSEDVTTTISTVFTELEKLGIENLRCGISIISKNRTMETWSISNVEEGKIIKGAGSFDMNAHPIWQRLYEGWEKKEELQESFMAGKEKEDYIKILNANPVYLSQPIRELPDMYREAYYFGEGAVWTYSLQPHSDEHKQVMKRFTSVFSLTFRRYQDLRKAEAQAREAQIEAALERVRAKAMAMHSSQDLVETIKVFYRQLDTLNLMPRRCGVGLINKETRIAELIGMVINDEGEAKEIAGKLTLKDHPVLENVYNCWVRQKDYYPVLRGNEIKEYYQLVGSQITIQNYPDDAVQFGYFFSFPEGQVYAWTDKEFTEDELKIYRRFTSVLSLTYKRYKDLKQAEAQAKEAQIEAGLERVRARTMAMHTSDDVSAATATMFTELEKLGIENLRCGVTIIHKDKTQEVWSVSNVADVLADHSEGQNKIVTAAGTFDMNAHPLWRLLYDKWDNKEEFLLYFLSGTDKEDYFKILNTTKGYLPHAIQHFPDTNFQVYLFGEGAVWSCSLQPHSEEQKQIMKRFTSVFSLTFRRYQDLKKAEAQAREATIEAALEKVRGKAMAMHNSNDLSITASMVFTELRKLGINPIRCGVGLLNNESLKAPLYSATSSEDGDHLSLVGWVMLEGHPVLEKIYDAWLKGEDYFPELKGDELRSYYENLLKGLSVPVPDWKDERVQYGHFIAFKVGCLYAWSDRRYNDDEIRVLKRFATIIDLTFRRYMELQQSEANARDAIKQAALDRIRADIASMRTITDLDRITPLIWNELTILGLPFIRCGVFIMDESQKLIHTFLSTPDGKAIGAFHLPYDTPGSFSVMLRHWLDKRIYIGHWTEVDFIGIAEVLVRQGAITTKEQYLNSLPRGGFYLHFLPFLQGMLYVGNTGELNNEQIELVQHVADAFSTAYARYEDFNKLEAAKQQVEKTLTDLKQAQTQLVQSEKMASLGELTAGIAHEIQNPLNFVNNFSDVSNELLEEMKDELAKGNIDDAIAIAEDVKQNLEKINHHGKRADGIVKGMLQHSRTSSGQKELTDINVLADEYLRLAYHGLRAKDKSFNAKFETDFDGNVGQINIIPQEIGRVILNLINNAFYAVSEKKKLQAASYEPLVAVRTKRLNDHIEIIVGDNGNGVPKTIVDKIFQPFFTTKPTGQGTGLGLSLAYDIIKAHGGEIKVETKEGEGSEFVIELPA